MFENFHGNPGRLPTDPLFTKDNVLKATKLYDYRLSLYMHKHNLSNDTQHPLHAYRLRNELNPVPHTRTNYGWSTLEYRVPSLYNKLKTHINSTARLDTN